VNSTPCQQSFENSSLGRNDVSLFEISPLEGKAFSNPPEIGSITVKQGERRPKKGFKQMRPFFMNNDNFQVNNSYVSVDFSVFSPIPVNVDTVTMLVYQVAILCVITNLYLQIRSE